LSSFAGTDLSNNIVHSGLTWRITPGQALRHREWQGEVVLYNDLSGDTHLLDESALHLLHILQDGPASEPALAGAVRLAFEAEDGEVDDASIAQLLAKLAALALIEAAA
jgi:PqqD family protein of HPr-rel-A system